ncbi:hypothetical protein [Nocardioides sp.]|uniref:hypothetical protein n=1 Tax=Nocardioides sp. TaxID=35761 RepID=UPI002736EB1D|nr:hypothetical protein [Nocardioides sp.]
MARGRDHRAWSAALDRLEQELVLVERLLLEADPEVGEPWEAPVLLGRMPMDLVPRAQEIQRRQVELHRRLAEAMQSNRRHQAVADRAHQLAPTPPAYLDTTA